MMLKHVVLMKLRDRIHEEQIELLFNEIKNLKNHLPGIMSFSHGMNVNQEHTNRGYTHAYTMDFVDSEFYQHFLNHPEQIKVKEKIKDAVVANDGLLIFNYPIELV